MLGTKHRDLFALLSSEFEPHEIKTRAGGGGRQLHYITSRTAMNRFDEVVGPESWRVKYRVEHMTNGTEAVVCTIAVKIDGEWVEKEDAGGFKEMTERNKAGETVEDEENTVKTGFSDAYKRCAVLWGVGRYLYRDGSPRYFPEGEVASDPSHAPAPREAMPSQARPDATQGGNPALPRPPHANGNGNGNGNGQDRAPRNGRGLFAWCKEQEQKHDVQLIPYLNKFIKLNEFPARMVDLDEQQVAMVHQEGMRKLAAAGDRQPGDEG